MVVLKLVLAIFLTPFCSQCPRLNGQARYGPSIVSLTK